MEDMTWPDIKDALAKGFTTVVVGVGSTEQHGPHLPLKTDALLGDRIAHGVASGLGKTLLAPTIRVGCSEHHLAFPGTVSLQAKTLKAIIHDYAESLQTHGFRTIIFLPSHGGNFAPLREAIDELRNRYPSCKIIGYTDLLGFIDAQYKVSEKFGISKEEGGAHAGEIETSLMLALARDLVVNERFAPGYIGALGEKEIKIILEKGMPALSESGVLGDPRNADKDRGKTYLEKTVDFLVGEIEKQLQKHGELQP